LFKDVKLFANNSVQIVFPLFDSPTIITPNLTLKV